MIVIKSPPYSKKCNTMLTFILSLIADESLKTASPNLISFVQRNVDDYFDLHLREEGCLHCADTATIALNDGLYRPPIQSGWLLCPGCSRPAERGQSTCGSIKCRERRAAP